MNWMVRGTLVLVSCVIGSVARGAEESWPGFRGVGGRGIAQGDGAPIQWDLESGRNVRWVAELPGLAHSSPVVWGDHVYVMTAESERDALLKVGLYGAGEPVPDEGEHTFAVMCLDRETGDVIWEEVCHVGVPQIQRHPKASHASSTPATDGEHVVAFFGSEGLYCLDQEGVLLWERQFGRLTVGAPEVKEYAWGFASSPVIHDGRVYVQCDAHEQSFLAALDLETGEDIWRTEREEGPTWCTPTVHVTATRAQVIANGYQHIGGYDLATGASLWKLVGGGDVPVPRPVVAGDLIILTSAHGRLAPIYAIRTAAEGTLTAFTDDDPSMAWSHPRRGIYMQTPLILGEVGYFCSDAGIVSRFDLKTGEMLDRTRLGSGVTGFSASAVAWGDVLYFTSEEGDIHVLRAGQELEPLAVNSMGETCMATPAIAGDTLFIRSRTRLTAIAEEK